MNIHPDEGLVAFDKIFNIYGASHDFNESDTRAKIIDGILIGCIMDPKN